MLINQENLMISKENYFKPPRIKFFLSELKPAGQVQLIKPGHAAFWYEGEISLMIFGSLQSQSQVDRLGLKLNERIILSKAHKYGFSSQAF